MPYELLSWSFFVWNGISRTASGLLYWIWNKIFGNTICCEAFVADDYQTTAWKRNKVDLSTASLWNTCKIALKNVLWILHEKEGNTERLFLTFYSLMTYLSALGLANCFFKYCTVFFFFFLWFVPWFFVPVVFCKNSIKLYWLWHHHSVASLCSYL